MTIRLFNLSRLLAKIVRSQRCPAGLCTLGVCALASVMAEPAQAQLIEALVYPDNSGAIGSAALAPEVRFSDHTSPVPQESSGVFVGPGGETSPLNVPSAIGSPQAAGRTRLVSQPFATGPFVQNQPVYQESGGAIPCPCDAGCDFSYYGSAEALYFRNDSSDHFTLSQNALMGPFDFEWAGRLTLGRVTDCVNGYEVVYAGPFRWSRSGDPGPGVNYQSSLVPLGVSPPDISAFNNATNHVQVHIARMNTYEVNRRWWAWDIFSTLIGLRVVDYRENFAFASLGSTSGNGPGVLLESTRNRMIGPQVGGELMQPVGLRTLVGVKGKGALLANFSHNNLDIISPLYNQTASDSEVDVAGLVEIGSYVKYSVTPSIRLTAGYEFWYLPEVATVRSQNPQFVSLTTNKVRADDELFIHGASFGAQILY